MDSIYENACLIRNAVLNDEPLTEYKDFSEKYPKLFAMLQNKSMDREMFEKLFQILLVNQTESGATQFSQFGAEKYLYPQFGKPSESDLKIANRKIQTILKK
jgi:hypothetical protein